MEGGYYNIMTKFIDDLKIYELYQNGLKHKDIAEQLGYGVSTVTQHLLDMGIKTRIPVDKETMIHLHENGLSDKEIANILKCTRSNVTIYLNRNGYINRKSKINNIELRNRISQSLIGRYVGELNPNYKGYLNEKIIARGIFKTISKRLIRNNNYTCSHCGKRGNGTRLETHHIKPFNVIFYTFIENVYDGNIENLYHQITSYHDFIDENNMVVLCHDCHWDVHYTDNHELSPLRWESATTIENTL